MAADVQSVLRSVPLCRDLDAAVVFAVKMSKVGLLTIDLGWLATASRAFAQGHHKATGDSYAHCFEVSRRVFNSYVRARLRDQGIVLPELANN